MAEAFNDTTNSSTKFKRKSTTDANLSQFVFGKVPPQARDLEEAVLGAIMLEKDALPSIVDFLKASSFYVPANQIIYQAIVRLFDKSHPIDILTVAEELRKTGELDVVGGAYYITELTNRVATAANVEFHARIIAQKFIQRELIRTSTEIVKEAFEDTTDVFELLDKSEKNLFEITNQNMRRGYADVGSLIEQAKKEILAASEHQDKLTGVASGFIALDRITGGWQKSDLVIIAARPGMGKTSFVLSMARNAAMMANKPVALFSLEMSSLQLTTRLMAAEAALPMEKLRKGNLAHYELQQLESKVHELSEAPIYIDDTPALNIFELRAKARRLKQQHGIEMIIIDYLQLMSGGSDNKGGGNREQEISTISRSLKNIAKELNIPVIALSQLSRAVETRGGTKRPQLSDLRESGAIEQDADMVIFLYRGDYYGIEVDENNQPIKGKTEVIIAKHRNGSLETVPIKFVHQLAKFEEWEESNIPEGYSRIEPQQGYSTMQSKINDPSAGEAKIDYDLGDEPPF
jgi:replicative DNA helicase